MKSPLINNVIKIIAGMFAAGLVVIGLFLSSERIIHYQNNFTRNYPPHSAEPVNELDLKFNSYYIAGQAANKIYLGNYTAPLKILEIDTTLKNQHKIQIELNQKNLPFRRPQIRIQDSTFVVFEGIAPYIFIGNTKNWTANIIMNSGRYFSQLKIIDANNVVIRYMKPNSGESILGTLNLRDTTNIKYNPNILQKQIDGVLDVEGALVYNKKLNKIIYNYRYRNQFFVVNPSNLNVDFIGKTIDTVSKAQIELVQIKNTTMKTFAKKPLVVNKIAATNDDWFFINSLVPGKYEQDKIWKIASIIDVYNLKTNTYRSSFPIYNKDNKRAKDFIVVNNQLFALIGTKIVRYKLRSHIE